MTTVINNPPGNTEDSGSNAAAIIVLAVVIIAAVVLFFIYGLPMIQNYSNPNNSSINLNITNTAPKTTTTQASSTP